MTKMTRNKLLSAIIFALMLFNLSLPAMTVFSDANTVTINSAEELIELQKNCKTDTWSQGKTIELAADIDLSKASFSPIPTFGGTFHGNSHTISGIKLTGKGSYQGLFRYVQKSGYVDNLNVTGNVSPDGSKEYVGGIAGEVMGTIEGCTFTGTVEGKNNIGGIAGYVTDTGKIKSCSFSGTVKGKSYTGGIAGQGYGEITACENRGQINTTNEESSSPLEELDLNTDIDLSSIRSTETINTNTDTGGICGYSRGRISACKNYGNVGYKSLGYNTGGICGRHSGYIEGCENHGEINGRKDVGGICGQAEPYVLLEFTEDVLEKMRGTLSDIRHILDTDLNLSDSEVSGSLDDINSSVTNVRKSLDAVSDDVTSYADDVAGNVNDVSDRLHNTLESSADVFHNISEGSDKLTNALSYFGKSAECLEEVADYADTAINGIDEADEELDRAGTFLSSASSEMAKGTGYLNDTVDSLYDGTRDMQRAIDDLTDALEKKDKIQDKFNGIWNVSSALQEELTKAGTSIGDIAKVLQSLLDNNYISDTSDEAIKNLKELGDCYIEIAKALSEIKDAALLLAGDFDIYSLRYGLGRFTVGFRDLSLGVHNLELAADKLEPSFDAIKSASPVVKDAITHAKDGINELHDGAEILTAATSDFAKILEDFTAGGAMTVPKSSDYLSEDFDRFSNSVKTMQDEFTNLRGILSDKQNHASNSLDDVFNDFETISDLFRQAYDDHINAGEDGFVEDVSDTDNSDDFHGKTVTSHNFGTVLGDINSGGITGSMAIEYDFDPEDDAINTGDKTLNFTYKTKCIIRRCTNEGEVSVRNKHGGGICGRMDLGTILSCENYGNVKTEDGNYIGGIAGESATTVKDSISKCTLTGNDYIGGICGKGKNITSCYTLVNIPEFGEYAGTIAGYADTNELSLNFFVGDTLGAVDDISYTGLAAKGDIAAFAEYVRSHFEKGLTFTLTFVADDKEIATLPFTYREAIPEEKIPKVPEKSGYYGKWSYYDYQNPLFDDTITAEYYRDMDIVSSPVTRDNGKAVMLLCGAFDDNVSLTATKGADMDGRKTLDSYDVKINGSYTDTYTIRYLPISENNRFDLYIKYSDTTEKARFRDFGSYKELKVPSESFTIFEVKKSYTVMIIKIFIGLVILTLFVLAIAFLKRKRRDLEPAENEE